MSLTNKIKIDKSLKKPIYQQIFDWVIHGINEGIFVTDYHLPSINQIASENQLARETVVKAFKLLQEKGIVNAIHGKGFFIASGEFKSVHHIFLLFDTLSAYKEVLYEAIQKQFGEEVYIDIYFHHFNPKTFENLVKEAAGNYTAYIVLPFDSPKITEMLEPIPSEKLFLLDRWPRYYKNQFHGVYQDFYNDVIKALNPFTSKIKLYKKLVLVFRDMLTELPLELMEGFEEFCYQNKIEYEIVKRALRKTQIEKNVAYLTLDDNDLVKLIEYANNQKWVIGKDLGIISYNDTPLKKVVANGITVISTNFEKMGKSIAQLVIDNHKECIANAGSLIDRGSF
jgi:DNA-binding transcriptional regulator YhcF (GntR family)